MPLHTHRSGRCPTMKGEHMRKRATTRGELGPVVTAVCGA